MKNLDKLVLNAICNTIRICTLYNNVQVIGVTFYMNEHMQPSPLQNFKSMQPFQREHVTNTHTLPLTNFRIIISRIVNV